MIFTLLLAAILQSVTPPLRVVDRGARSLVDTARTIVVRDDAAWAALWAEHAPDRPRPAVEFSTEMVVGVFAGTRPTPGYAVEIAGWREAGGALVVSYRETRPGRDLLRAQVLTSPFALVAVPRSPAPVTFESAGQ